MRAKKQPLLISEVQLRFAFEQPLRVTRAFLHPKMGDAALYRDKLSHILFQHIQEIWEPGTDQVVDETIVKYFGKYVT
jgi:hypothetical protein